MNNPKNINITNYTYDLPHHRIAKYPLAKRDESKLLIYKNGQIFNDVFYQIHHYLPQESTLIINESKVIPARMYMNSESGKKHEVFCLEPIENSKNETIWKCLARGVGKKTNQLFCKEESGITLYGRVVDKVDNAYHFQFEWKPTHLSFVEVLTNVGEMPIPPYLKRKSEPTDKNRYQTVYAKKEGSVAAPTAGLHFTEKVFKKLAEKNINLQQVTLHVGAGTFQPVKSNTLEGHTMHEEWMNVSKKAIKSLLHSVSNEKPIVAVGTTSLRTIESIYWMGVKALQKPKTLDVQGLSIQQWDVYDLPQEVSLIDGLQALIQWMNNNNSDHIFCKTQLLIAPPYRIRVANALLTNFHQPNSTLLLLVASILKEQWREVYDYALANDYRFLSYGDSSLLFV